MVQTKNFVFIYKNEDLILFRGKIRRNFDLYLAKWSSNFIFVAKLKQNHILYLPKWRLDFILWISKTRFWSDSVFTKTNVKFYFVALTRSSFDSWSKNKKEVLLCGKNITSFCIYFPEWESDFILWKNETKCRSVFTKTNIRL